MPIRLTPNKSLLISYDDRSKSWVTIEGISLFLLSQYVDVEPGVTIEHVFNMIDRDASLKRFLAEYCSCDLDAFRTRTAKNPKPIEIPVEVEWDEINHGIVRAYAPADTIAVIPSFGVFTDEHTGARRLEGSYTLEAKSSKHDDCSISLGAPRSVTYAEIKDLYLALDSEMNVTECDEDKQIKGENNTIAFSAQVRYTLLDVLTAIVGHFGEPIFDARYQREIDDEIEMLERIRRKYGKSGPTEDA